MVISSQITMGVMLAVFGLSMTATLARACTPASHVFAVNKATQYQADGSFKFAGVLIYEENVYGQEIEGSAIVDIGNGRVGQKVVSSGLSCGSSQSLMFTNCLVPDAVAFSKAMGEIGGGFAYDSPVVQLQPPHGPVALTPDATVKSLIKLAARDAAIKHFDPVALQDDYKPRDRFDPFRGCQIYYPESAGAGKATGRLKKKG